MAVDPLVTKPDGYSDAIGNPLANAIQPLGGSPKSNPATLDLNAGFLNGEDSTNTSSTDSSTTPESPAAPNIFPVNTPPEAMSAPPPAAPAPVTPMDTPSPNPSPGGGTNTNTAPGAGSSVATGAGPSSVRFITSDYMAPDSVLTTTGQSGGQARLLANLDERTKPGKNSPDSTSMIPSLMSMGAAGAQMLMNVSNPGMAIMGAIRTLGELSLGKPSVGKLYQTNINSVNGVATPGEYAQDNEGYLPAAKFMMDTTANMANGMARDLGVKLNFGNVGLGDMYGMYYTDFGTGDQKQYRWHTSAESAIADAAFYAMEKSGAHLSADQRKKYFDQIKYDLDQVRSIQKPVLEQTQKTAESNWISDNQKA